MTKSVLILRSIVALLVTGLLASCASQPYTRKSDSNIVRPRPSNSGSNNAVPLLIGAAAIGGLVYAAKKSSDRNKKKNKHYDHGYYGTRPYPGNYHHGGYYGNSCDRYGTYRYPTRYPTRYYGPSCGRYPNRPYYGGYSYRY